MLCQRDSCYQLARLFLMERSVFLLFKVRECTNQVVVILLLPSFLETRDLRFSPSPKTLLPLSFLSIRNPNKKKSKTSFIRLASSSLFKDKGKRKKISITISGSKTLWLGGDPSYLFTRGALFLSAWEK